MTTTSTADDRRAQHVAALGFLLQLVAYGALLTLSVWAGSDAMAAVSRLLMIGLPIWGVLYLVLKQIAHVRREQLETAELKRAHDAGTSSTIFELADEDLLIEQSRLKWLVKWVLPATTIVVALTLILGHLFLWGVSAGAPHADEHEHAAEIGFQATTNPSMMMWFAVGIGFVCFLYARYTIALAKLPNWRLLRAGAACMAGNAVACLCLVITLMAATSVEWAEPLLVTIMRYALVILGIEFALNFILDFYRPRVPGTVPRPSFDSRLLGLVTEPGGIAKSIADTVNYQFGFEVSSTWFYQLLQRWLFPIMVFTCLAVTGLSSIVIVDADEQVVIERFGRISGGSSQVLNPGFYFKWPFPIDIARRAPVRRIEELVIGEASETEDDFSKAILWTEAHDFVPELMLVVASSAPKGMEPATTTAGPAAMRGQTLTQSVAVSLLMVSVPIEYRVKDIKKFLYKYDDPTKLMKGVASRILSDYAAGVDMDELMGPGREAFNRVLHTKIQDRLDELDVGIEIVFVGICGAHPPAKDKVAEAFQGVVAALTQRTSTINAAEGIAQAQLTGIAGTATRAETIDAAIVARDAIQAQPNVDSEALAEAERLVNRYLLGDPATGIPPISGTAAKELATARAEASGAIARAVTKTLAFDAMLAAYQAAPILFLQRQRLSVYNDIDSIRKFLIMGDPEKLTIIWENQELGGLDQVLSEGVAKQQ